MAEAAVGWRGRRDRSVPPHQPSPVVLSPYSIEMLAVFTISP